MVDGRKLVQIWTGMRFPWYGIRGRKLAGGARVSPFHPYKITGVLPCRDFIFAFRRQSKQLARIQKII
jgi:hypothetical protein